MTVSLQACFVVRASLLDLRLLPRLCWEELRSTSTRVLLRRRATPETFRSFEQAKHIGSMNTVRTVLPRTEGTDAGRALVERPDEGLFSMCLGKLATCVGAARGVTRQFAAALGDGSSAGTRMFVRRFEGTASRRSHG